MSLIAQHIPKVGLVMDEVTVVRWLKSVGDAVVAGEPLIEVETEKSVVEIEAAASGRLSQILVQAGARAAVGDQAGWIEAAAEAAAPHAAKRLRSSPVARKVAAEHGIDLGAIAGSGPGGRIQLHDVQRAVDAPATPGAPTAGPTKPGEELHGAAAQPLSSMRRALARAMTLSNATVPQFTVSRSVEWTVLQEVRREFSVRTPPGSPKLSPNDFLLQAVARTLMEFPDLNATFSGDPQSADARIEHADGAHIGLVVAIQGGLLVPVIHDVEKLSLVEIARRRQSAVEGALEGRLKRDETGATFSISNLGAEGPDRFTAIINPPQSAILAVGRRRDCVVARDGAAAVRSVSDLTMTVDHRVADGRLASQFLARLTEVLEGRRWNLE